MIERTIRSPNWTARPRGLADVYGVIIHHTATSEKSPIAVAQFFANRASKVSAHYVIGMNQAGTDAIVVKCVDIERAAWHAGRSRQDFNDDGRFTASEYEVNRHTIGIEFCNKGDGIDTYHPKMIKAGAIMIRRAMKVCGNMHLDEITDHQAVNLLGKIDVRRNFPAARLFWYILNPHNSYPPNAYDLLPQWAKRQINEIKR